MRLFIPSNIFSSIFSTIVSKEYGIEIISTESSLLTKKIENDTTAIVLIPTLDLINHRTLFVSSELGISFDGLLANAYFYFNNRERAIEKVYLRGDISINEIILTKILLAERYSSNVEIILDNSKEIIKENDYIIVGDDNFINKDFENGISFADHIAEMIDLPYVNFVFAAQEKESLQKLHKLIVGVDEKIENDIQNILDLLNLSEIAKTFILDNLGSVYFEMRQNEIDAINELIKLVYYHGISDDIFEIKFSPSL